MYLKIISIVVFIITVLGVFFLTLFPSQAIKLRETIFTKKFNYSIYNYPNSQNILIDDIDVLSRYRNFKRTVNFSNSALPNKFKSNEEIGKIVAIANLTDTIYNGKLSGGGKYIDLFDLENHLLDPNRGGRCSDYSEYFLAQLLLNGFFAREVSNLNHTAIEVYVKSLKKWIWVDSQFDLFILDFSGNILNAYEISRLSQNEFVFYPFNKKLFNFYKKFPECYISKKAFSQLVYSVDSRVFESNDYRGYISSRLAHSVLMTVFFEKSRMILNN